MQPRGACSARACGSPSPPGQPFGLLDLQQLLALLTCVADAVAAEPTVVPVPAPCKVFGDIHGQLAELRELFRVYGSPNHRTGDINGFGYIFLGDYVDRGPHSLEVLALLAALKLRYPSRVTLVRGNHEDRGINAAYGFRQVIRAVTLSRLVELSLLNLPCTDGDWLAF